MILPDAPTNVLASIAERSGFQLLPKIFTPRGNILLAERRFAFHQRALPEITGPHWQMLWGLERDGKFMAAQPLFFHTDTTHEGRVRAAVKEAESYMREHDFAVSPGCLRTEALFCRCVLRRIHADVANSLTTCDLYCVSIDHSDDESLD